jgi:hypothetical protein
MKYSPDLERPVLGPVNCKDCGEPLWYAARPSRARGILVRKLAWRNFNGLIHRHNVPEEGARASTD